MQSVSQKIIRFFPDTDLRCGHDGLSEIAKEHKINVQSLGAGEFVVFTNRKKTAVKLYAANYTVVHQRMVGGAKIDMRVISLIPKYFNGTKINIDGAVKEIITKALG